MNGDPEANGIPLGDKKCWDFALSNFLLYAPSNKLDREQLLDKAVGDMAVKGFTGLPAWR